MKGAVFVKKYLPFGLFVFTFFILLKVLLLPSYPDFQVHYFGAVNYLNGVNPYIADSRYFTSQVYPPIDMIFFIPYTFASVEVVSKLWTVLSLIAVLFSIYLCCRVFKIAFFSPINMIFCSLLFISFPLKFSLGMGQVNTIILFFVVLSFYFINLGKFKSAGNALAFPIVLKFTPILLIPYFLYSKKWKIVISLSTTLLIFIIITFALFPNSVIVHFYGAILPDLLFSWKGDYYNQALSGLLVRNISDVFLRTICKFVLSLALIVFNFIIIILVKKKTKWRINLEISSLILLGILINSFSWQHHFVLTMLPFFIIGFTIYKKNSKFYLYFLLGICYLLISANFKNPNILPLLFQSHVFFGGLILWATNLYILVKYKV